MEALAGFRRFAYSLRRKYIQKRRAIRPPMSDGLPEGISPDIINAVCVEHLNEKPLSFFHQHLSGWKLSGAYRLVVKTRSGNTIRLIYKDAVYRNDQIPALINLSIHPGPPEYAIYSQPVGSMAPYLPRVYLAEEVIPGIQYRYILEDLSQNFHKLYTLDDISRFCSMLPRLHQALSEWSKELKPIGLLMFGKGFSQALQEYARENLERYGQQSSDPELLSVLNCWSPISELHLSPEFLVHQPNEPIHGDTNYTNIHIHNRDPYQFKIVDWEWAGIGLPHADLASLLKGMPEDIVEPSIRKFLGSTRNPNPCLNPALTPEENKRLYLWCQLERGLLDAAFLTAQHLNAANVAGFSLPEAISRALRQVFAVFKQLSN